MKKSLKQRKNLKLPRRNRTGTLKANGTNATALVPFFLHKKIPHYLIFTQKLIDCESIKKGLVIQRSSSSMSLGVQQKVKLHVAVGGRPSPVARSLHTGHLREWGDRFYINAVEVGGIAQFLDITRAAYDLPFAR